MTEPQNPSPRSRLQALLAIPDNQRSEEQWDELHELEITLAPGNRIGQQEKQNPLAGPGKGGGGGGGGGRGGPMGNPRGGPKGAPRGENRGGGRGGQMPRQANNGQRKPADAPQAEGGAAEGAPVEGGAEIPAGGAPAKKPFRRFHKKPPKPAES
ncbi:MAG: hypothetical protein Q8O79_00570 [Pseudomonadota bacterium]|nr:hypothetical protein [Pseudomonadota bacterium]